MEQSNKSQYIGGKGLAALLSPPDYVEKKESNSVGAFIELDIDLIKPKKEQPRNSIENFFLYELSDSIRQHGLFHPIIIRKAENDCYEIVAGERRWRASKLAGLRTIPCFIKNFDDQEGAEIALIENIQRQNLSPIEEAKSYLKLVEEFGYSYELLATRLNKSRSHIVNMIRITKLPIEVQQLVQEGKISAGHARALLSFTDPLAGAYEIINLGLNVRQVEKMVKNQREKRGINVKKNEDQDVLMLKSKLESIYNRLCDIYIEENSAGKVILHFNDLIDLDYLFNQMVSIVKK